MGMSVLTKAKDIKLEAVETVVPCAAPSELAPPEPPPKGQSANVSEDAKDDDADSSDGWETHSLLEELLNDVTPYAAAGIFLLSYLLLKRGLPNSNLRTGHLHAHRGTEISPTAS